MASILIVEDDAELATTISEVLTQEGHAVRSASSLEEGSRAIQDAPDLVLVDVGLPDGSGLDFVSRATEENSPSTMVLMSGDANDEAVIRGLGDGAVDFLPKPFSLAVLRARVETALRARARSVDVVHRIGDYRFSPSEQSLARPDGKSIALTRRESDILKKLLQATGPVERKTLLKEVWGYSERVATHTVETHIYRLRQKIEMDPSNPRLLVTQGKGYALAT